MLFRKRQLEEPGKLQDREIMRLLLAGIAMHALIERGEKNQLNIVRESLELADAFMRAKQ
jgi:hypothetical protein